MNPLQLLWILPVAIMVIAWKCRPNKTKTYRHNWVMSYREAIRENNRLRVDKLYQQNVSPSQVKCETCKHWVDREDCQEVTINGRLPLSYNEYYCPIHKKPYDNVVVNYSSPDENHRRKTITRYFKTIPAHEVEVDEEGKEINKK